MSFVTRATDTNELCLLKRTAYHRLFAAIDVSNGVERRRKHGCRWVELRTRGVALEPGERTQPRVRDVAQEDSGFSCVICV